MLTQVAARVIYEKVGFLHWVIFSGVDFIHSLPSGNKFFSSVLYIRFPSLPVDICVGYIFSLHTDMTLLVSPLIVLCCCSVSCIVHRGSR